VRRFPRLAGRWSRWSRSRLEKARPRTAPSGPRLCPRPPSGEPRAVGERGYGRADNRAASSRDQDSDRSRHLPSAERAAAARALSGADIRPCPGICPELSRYDRTRADLIELRRVATTEDLEQGHLLIRRSWIRSPPAALRKPRFDACAHDSLGAPPRTRTTIASRGRFSVGARRRAGAARLTTSAARSRSDRRVVLLPSRGCQLAQRRDEPRPPGQAHGVGAAVGRVWLADDQTVALELVEKGNQARLVIFDRLSER